MRACVRLGVLAAGLWALPPLPALAQAEDAGAIVDFGTSPDLVIVNPVPLGPEEFAAMREFMDLTDYFGAFAVDPGPGNSFYWVTGYQSQTLATEVAYAGCKGLAEEGADCVVHARIDPAGYRLRLGRPAELGAPAARTWREFYLPGLKPGTWAAFASSGMSSGATVEATTKVEAESLALVECESAVASSMRELSAPARDAVRRGGQHLCKVIDVRGP